MIRVTFIILVLTTLLHANKVTPRLGILTPVVQNLEAEESRVFLQSLHLSAAMSGYFNVLSEDEINNHLRSIGEQTAPKCLTESCFKSLGKKLKIPLVIGSFASKKDNLYIIETRLYDVQKSKTIAKGIHSITADSISRIIDLCKISMENISGYNATVDVLQDSIKQDITIENNIREWIAASATVLGIAGYFAYELGILLDKDENPYGLISPGEYNDDDLSNIRGFFASRPLGARYAAMGYIGTSAVNDGFSALYNPAGLASVSHHTFSLSHSQLPTGIPSTYINYSSPIKRTFIQSQSFLYEGDDLSKQLQFLSSYSMDLSLFSKYLKSASLGATAKGYLIQVGQSGTGIAKSTGFGKGYGFDVGFQSTLLGGFGIGAVLKDLYSQIHYTNTLTQHSYKEAIPPYFLLGIHYNYNDDLIIAFDNQKSINKGQKDRLSIGVEKSLMGLIKIRAGVYQILNQSSFRTLTLGFGLQHKQGRYQLKMNYSYEYGENEAQLLNGLQNISLSLEF